MATRAVGVSTIQLPYPHTGQQAVMRHPARFKWLSAGRRWRKTTLDLSVAVQEALQGYEILWGAPTYDQCRIAWGELEHALGGWGQMHVTRMEATFPTGGEIIFRSLDDPDNARGHTADGVILDEVALIKSVAWYEVIRPILSDTGGWLLATGTPNGRNWFWQESQKAMDEDDSVAWQVPTLGVAIKGGELVRRPHMMENPDFPFEEAQRMFRTLPRRIFEQEFLAAFIEDAGGVFRGVSAVATLEPQEPQEGHQYVMGVDWAKSVDFTVITVLDVTTKQMVAMDRFNEIDYRLQSGRLQGLAKRYDPTVIMAEANAMGEPIIERLQTEEGLPVQRFTTTNTTKAQIVEGLELAIEQGELELLDDPVLVGELQAFEMDRLPSGRVRYNAPEGMHDDTVMSLALAWHAIGRRLYFG